MIGGEALRARDSRRGARRRPVGGALAGVLIALAAVCGFDYGSRAVAQTVIAGPQRIDRNPARARRRVRRPRLRLSQPTVIQTPDVPAVALRAVTLAGSSVPDTLLRPAWTGALGQPLSAAVVRRIADGVAAAYARTDVALYTVSVPTQSYAGGDLQLAVTEDRIVSLDLRPDPGVRVSALVRRLGAEVLRERPLTRSSLERFLALVRDIPGVTADVKLVDAGAPGAVTLQIVLHQRRIQASAEINNTGQAPLGIVQATATVSVNSLLREGDQTLFTTLFSPGDSRLRYYALMQTEPLGAGALVQANVGYLTTHLGPLNGRATTLGLQASYPFYRDEAKSLVGRIGIDGLNDDGAFLGDSISSDHTRALRLSLTYAYEGQADALAVVGGWSRGLSIFGARVTSLALSDPTFTKLTYSASYDHTFSPKWIVRVRSQGQFGFSALPTVEQLALGGPLAGRAFDSISAIGDSGVYGSVEMARTFAGDHRLFLPAELYGFTDAGYVRYRQRAIYAGVDQHLASLGLGVRTTLVRNLVLELEEAHALSQAVYPAQRANRINASLRATF